MGEEFFEALIVPGQREALRRTERAGYSPPPGKQFRQKQVPPTPGTKLSNTVGNKEGQYLAVRRGGKLQGRDG